MSHDSVSYETVQLARDVHEYATRIYALKCHGIETEFLESMLQESLTRLVNSIGGENENYCD